MSRLSAIILAIVLAASCADSKRPLYSNRQYALEPRWQPLYAVVEGTDKVFAAGAMTTIGHYAYVPSLRDWEIEYPINSPGREAILRHEQIHSVRQLNTGINLWIAKYAADKEFRLAEEKIGYEVQIRYLYSQGLVINAEEYAGILSQNYAGMITYEDALTWLRNLIELIKNEKN